MIIHKLPGWSTVFGSVDQGTLKRMENGGNDEKCLKASKLYFGKDLAEEK